MTMCPDLRLMVVCDGAEMTPSVHQAVAQLSAECEVELTVARLDTPDSGAPPAPIVFDCERAPRRVQRLALDRSDGAAAVADLCGRARFDLVMTSTSATVWPSWRPSLRSQLLARLAQTGVPLWTAGAELPAMHFLRPIRSVACLLDFEAHPKLLLARAAAFAEHMRARLHVLAALPSIDESMLASAFTSDAPLLPAAAVARVEQMYTGPLAPVIDVVVDAPRRGMKRLVAACQPDLLFVDADHASRTWPFGLRPALDRLRCPAVCVPAGAAFGAWSFERAWAALSSAPSGASAFETVPVDARRPVYLSARGSRSSASGAAHPARQ